MTITPVEAIDISGTSTTVPDVSHYVRCPDEFPNALTWVEHARAHGLEVTSLCGRTWVPTVKPDGLPVCPLCVAIANQAYRDADNV